MRYQQKILALLAWLGLSGAFAGSLEAQLLDDLIFESVANGLAMPVNITHADDGSGRLFINEQAGRIVIYDGADIVATPFLDIRGRVLCCGERGLLGLAFHPNYQENGRFFVNYINGLGSTVISEFLVSEDPNRALSDSERILLTFDQPFGNHNAGHLQFGPDGFLYIATGDGGSGGDPGDRGQSLATLLGKILRIDVDSGAPFAIPPSNPFVGQAARGEIWAYGLRNPWRFSFDRETGDMFIGDVGQNAVEEIDFQPAASPGGENYGWRHMEGSQCFIPAADCNDGSLVLPIIDYQQNGQGGSVTGGYRYRGFSFPPLQGTYFFADFVMRAFYAANQNNGAWTVMGPRPTPFSISTFGEDEAGELYFADYAAGRIYQIQIPRLPPALLTVVPMATMSGSPDVTITLTGTNLVPDSQVRWNGVARPTIFVDNTRLQAMIPASDLATPGAAQITVFTPAPGGGLSVALEFMVEAPPGPVPEISDGGVGNAAGVTGVDGAAGGMIAAVFGIDLSLTTENSPVSPLPTSLGGGMMRFTPNDAALRFGAAEIDAPFFFASPDQVNIQIPWELLGLQEALLTAIVGDEQSAPELVTIVPFNPGIFTTAATGEGQGSILIAGTTTLAAPVGAFPDSRPARRGEFVAIFATGLGPVTNMPASGAPASDNRLSETITLPQVTIGGVPATVTFSGLAPGFVGLYQINVEIPAGAPSGGAIDVVVTIGDVSSNVVTIAVE